MEFWVSQICGLIVSIAAVASLQLKNIKYIMLCQLVCNTVGAFSYIMLGGFSGCGIYLIAVVQTLAYTFLRIKEKKAPSALAVIFAAMYVLCTVLTYGGPHDIVAGLAALSCAFALAQEKPSGYRFLILLNGSIWVIYDISVGAYTMIIAHAATIISSGIGILRFDLGRNKKGG